MKNKLPLLLLLLPATLPIIPAATEPTAGLSAVAPAPSPAAILISQLEEITASTTLSTTSQAKLIASAVRTAIATAIDGMKEPTRRFDAAMELTLAAVKAVPQFASTITQATLSVPAIAAMDGAAEKIEAAVQIALDSVDSPEIANPVANPPRPPAAPEFGGSSKGETVVSPSA